MMSREIFSFLRILLLPQPGLFVGLPSRLTENCRQKVGVASLGAFQESWQSRHSQCAFRISKEGSGLRIEVRIFLSSDCTAARYSSLRTSFSPAVRGCSAFLYRS